MEKPLNRPPELLRQADAIFAALVANPEIPEPGRGYGLRFGISPLGALLLADRHGKQASEPPGYDGQRCRSSITVFGPITTA